MKPTVIDPKTTPRAEAYTLWMNAPNPMVTFFKTLDVTPLVRLSRKRGLKFNMLLCWCIGKAASQIKEFYPVSYTHLDVYMRQVCDGERVFPPGIMELVERTGIHSGDSMSVYPPFSLSAAVKAAILEYTTRLGLGIGIVGLFNIQFIVDADEHVYVIEVNPRASRSVPFLSKATGCPLVAIAARTMLGQTLAEQGITEPTCREKEFWYVKAPAFSFRCV